MVASIPRAALMLLGGAVSDRASPRRILIVSALARAVLVGTVAVLLFLKSLQLWELFLLVFGFGVADAFSYPAGSAILPTLVESEQLPAANSLSQSTQQITTLLAPGPAGLFIRAFGNAWAFVFDGVSFFAIILALIHVPDQPSIAVNAEKQSMVQSIAGGLQYVLSDIPIRSLMLVIAVLNFGLAGPLTVGLAMVAKQEFGTASSFGLLISSTAAGSLTGMLCAGVIRHRRRGLTLLLSSVLIGVCVAVLGLLRTMTILVPDLFLMSGITAFLSIALIAWLQQRVDSKMMGRVMSVLMFASVGLTPLSLALAGFALKISVPGTFFSAGAMVIVVTLLAASHPAVRTID
jgi:MFS family permease